MEWCNTRNKSHLKPSLIEQSPIGLSQSAVNALFFFDLDKSNGETVSQLNAITSYLVCVRISCLLRCWRCCRLLVTAKWMSGHE